MGQSHMEDGGIMEVLLLLLLHNTDGSQLFVFVFVFGGQLFQSMKLQL